MIPPVTAQPSRPRNGISRQQYICHGRCQMFESSDDPFRRWKGNDSTYLLSSAILSYLSMQLMR